MKYNETGQQSNYPPSCEDYGWCVETDLDIDMVSAACPKCTIYLMEAKDGPISDFETAEKEAVTLGATILSNSWSCYGSWDCGDSNFPNYFNTTGIAYLASTGDDGYNTIGGPSVLASVIAVGGTQLAKSGSTYTETIWNDAAPAAPSSTVVGSPGVPKPSWQHDPGLHQPHRRATYRPSPAARPALPCISALYGGWIGVCGTSVASPFTRRRHRAQGQRRQTERRRALLETQEESAQERSPLYHAAAQDGRCGGEVSLRGRN